MNMKAACDAEDDLIDVDKHTHLDQTIGTTSGTQHWGGQLCQWHKGSK